MRTSIQYSEFKRQAKTQLLLNYEEFVQGSGKDRKLLVQKFWNHLVQVCGLEQWSEKSLNRIKERWLDNIIYELKTYL